jgi:hypothetical protein
MRIESITMLHEMFVFQKMALSFTCCWIEIS